LRISIGQTERLLGRYGSLIGELAALVAERPDLAGNATNR